MSEMQMDFTALDAASGRLRAAAVDLDELGERIPSGGDYGAAAVLVGLALGLQVEASALLATEAATLGFAVGLCREDMAWTDAQQVVDLIAIGEAS